MDSTPVITPAWGGAAARPWGKATPPSVPKSLEDVMSEELAQELQREEESKIGMQSQAEQDIDLASLMSMKPEDTANDFLMAQMLQHEFDKEHDSVLQREEDKWNGSSKVKISYKKYRCVHPSDECEEDMAEEDYPHQDMHDIDDDPVPKFNRSGISGRGKNIVTKHDSAICSKKNGMRVMEHFPPGFETGDGHKYKMRIPNHVYNDLKRHAEKESQRRKRIHEKKEFSTAEQAVDANTRLILYKLVNNGVLESVEGVVSSGKESVVFHATGGSMNDAIVPEECAIKVFKTTLSEFKNRFQYVRGDSRFLKDEFKKWSSRKIIKVWAEKELANLKKMEASNIPCPKAIVLKKHVLVMSFLGHQQVAAPKLKDAKLSVAELQMAYAQCVDNMIRMYNNARLVHADLSEYNMLWWQGSVHFIDVAQGVDVMHPRAAEFLLRDCNNVSQFFEGAGVTGVYTPEQLFNQITGLAVKGEGKEFLAQMEQYEKNEDKLRLDIAKDYPFDFFFGKAQVEREEHRKMEELFHDTDSDESTGTDEEEDSQGEDEQTPEEPQLEKLVIDNGDCDKAETQGTRSQDTSSETKVDKLPDSN